MVVAEETDERGDGRSRGGSGLRSWTTSPAAPLRQGRFASALRDERVAAYLGATLALLFSVCFLTGLYSHLQQHPQGWFPIPTHPAGLYRVTQGVHVATGIASLPVLVAKLWVVWPRFLSFPPVRDLGHLVERIGLLPLVGGGVFMVFSGIANIAQWYPWPFSFTASHFWMAWVTMGALVAHAGAKWTISRRALARPSRRPALGRRRPGARQQRRAVDTAGRRRIGPGAVSPRLPGDGRRRLRRADPGHGGSDAARAATARAVRRHAIPAWDRRAIR